MNRHAKETNTMDNAKKSHKTYNGFAIPLLPDTDLGLAMLIAEDDGGNCQPVAVASTISEGKELAASDMRERMRKLERGEDACICPIRYKLWARGIDGEYLVATTIEI
jgi:hypothetical protein